LIVYDTIGTNGLDSECFHTYRALSLQPGEAVTNGRDTRREELKPWVLGVSWIESRNALLPLDFINSVFV
jgi:hypothetical protein